MENVPLRKPIEDNSMKSKIRLTTVAMLLASGNLFAHHPAADIVDEEIYEMIDLMVEDTPHAMLTFDEMGGGMTVTNITTDTLSDFEKLVAQEDLLEYVEQLDGTVDVSLSFNDDRSVTMTVSQVR